MNTQPIADPYVIDCPDCGAGRGEKCHDEKAGRFVYRETPHDARVHNVQPAQHAPQESDTMTIDREDALSIVCPICDARPGISCEMYIDGLPENALHRKRFAIAAIKKYPDQSLVWLTWAMLG